MKASKIRNSLSENNEQSISEKLLFSSIFSATGNGNFLKTGFYFYICSNLYDVIKWQNVQNV